MTDQAKRAEPVIMTEIVFPQDTNPMGTMFGGAAYALMDKAAFVAASRFSGSIVVTASSESDGDSRGVDLDGSANGALLPGPG